MRSNLLRALLFLVVPALMAMTAKGIFLKPSQAKFRIVLDPGHGGKDSVTRAGGFYEKNIVLHIALELRKKLQENGYEVIMTRESDKFISLSDRSAVKGDVFISLHANSVADSIGPSVRSMIKGIEIYTDPNMENGSGLSTKSRQLASCFEKSLSSLDGISFRAMRQKSLAVLNKNESPAILIELGFLTHESDLVFLTSEWRYKTLSLAFIKAIQSYQTSQKGYY